MVYESDQAGRFDPARGGGRHAAGRSHDRPRGCERGPAETETRSPRARTRASPPRRAPAATRRRGASELPARRTERRRRRAREGLAAGAAHRKRARRGPRRGRGERPWRADRESGRRKRRCGRAPAPSPRADPGRRRDGEGHDDRGGADEAAADRRAADGRVEGDDPRLQHRDRGRHGGVRAPARAAEDAGARGLRGGADLQRHGRQGMCARAARAPDRERQLPRRARVAALARERRRGGRGGERAGRADGLRRRHESPRRDRPRDPRARRARARGDDHAARARRRHVHRLEPGHVRDQLVCRHHQPAAGGDHVRRRAGTTRDRRRTPATSSRAAC